MGQQNNQHSCFKKHHKQYNRPMAVERTQVWEVAAVQSGLHALNNTLQGCSSSCLAHRP